MRQIDLPAAQPELIAEQLHATFGIDPAEILNISAKTGEGVGAVLQAIQERIPPPKGDADSALKALLFDSSLVRPVINMDFCLTNYILVRYDRYRGVISLVSIQDGVMRKGSVLD
jgi:translation factor GUF1, mitochondrial